MPDKFDEAMKLLLQFNFSMYSKHSKDRFFKQDPRINALQIITNNLSYVQSFDNSNVGVKAERDKRLSEIWTLLNESIASDQFTDEQKGSLRAILEAFLKDVQNITTYQYKPNSNGEIRPASLQNWQEHFDRIATNWDQKHEPQKVNDIRLMKGVNDMKRSSSDMKLEGVSQYGLDSNDIIKNIDSLVDKATGYRYSDKILLKDFIAREADQNLSFFPKYALENQDFANPDKLKKLMKDAELSPQEIREAEKDPNFGMLAATKSKVNINNLNVENGKIVYEYQESIPCLTIIGANNPPRGIKADLEGNLRVVDLTEEKASPYDPPIVSMSGKAILNVDNKEQVKVSLVDFNVQLFTDKLDSPQKKYEPESLITRYFGIGRKSE